MRYRIKSRLAELNKKSVDVVAEIRRRGITCDPVTFSNAINGRRLSPKCELICDAADKIISEWEKDRKHL